MKEKVIQARIKIAIAAYLYEIKHESWISDHAFDQLALYVDKTKEIKTNHVCDEFFSTQFDPSTGMWIYQHPELFKIAALAVYVFRLTKCY